MSTYYCLPRQINKPDAVLVSFTRHKTVRTYRRSFNYLWLLFIICNDFSPLVRDYIVPICILHAVLKFVIEICISHRNVSRRFRSSDVKYLSFFATLWRPDRTPGLCLQYYVIVPAKVLEIVKQIDSLSHN